MKPGTLVNNALLTMATQCKMTMSAQNAKDST